MELSVVICSHNPRRDYLSRTLDALRGQTLSREKWELLLIDNVSTPPLAGGWDLSWHPGARHILEEKLGIMPARLRGVQEVRTEFIVFVDDDNVLPPNYLAVMLDLAIKYPNLGCIGAGIVEPEFELEPAPDLRPHTHCLALKSVASTEWSNVMTDSIILCGAGMGFRRVAGERCRESVMNCPVRMKLGRAGSDISYYCEDDEFVWAAVELGYGKGQFPELKVTHLISAKRVSKDYLVRMTLSQAFSKAILEDLHGLPLTRHPKPSTLGDVLQSLLHGKVSATLKHAGFWWRRRTRPPVDVEFDEARYQGVQRAVEEIRNRGKAKAEIGKAES